MPIELLDPSVANAIAAGEVVDRPASVVKELIENALDADARDVNVEIQGAGLSRILVVDDGAGIPAQELPLAFARHATSKLQAVADLEGIVSLGFRGEALASIAAVARVECRTTSRNAGHGAALVVDYGRAGPIELAPPAPGTRVEVLGLFENTPARRAFLKRPATEAAVVVRAVAALGLARPDVALSLHIDGRRALRLPGDGDRGRAFAVVGHGFVGLLPVAGARGSTSVSGVIAQPSDLRRSRAHLYLSVNQRPVMSRSLAFAVEQAYRGLVGPGLFPAGALDITVARELVDVNVHPTKREVRFRDEREVFSLLQQACLEALQHSSAYTGAGVLTRPQGERGAERTSPVPAHQLREAAAVPYLSGEPSPGAVATASRGSLPIYEQDLLAGIERRLLRGPFRLLGQLLDSYIVAEGPGGLVLVDQHAAHERVIFNQLVAGRARVQRQPLLVPALLHLTPVQSACLAESRSELAAAGLEIEEFGGSTARLVEYDPVLPERGLDRLALEVLDSLIQEGREIDLSRRLERATYTVACHSAVKFGQRLGRAEMEALLRELELADPGITCPHGRPTMLDVTETQLRRQFHRS